MRAQCHWYYQGCAYAPYQGAKIVEGAVLCEAPALVSTIQSCAAPRAGATVEVAVSLWSTAVASDSGAKGVCMSHGGKKMPVDASSGLTYAEFTYTRTDAATKSTPSTAAPSTAAPANPSFSPTRVVSAHVRRSPLPCA